MDETLRQLGGLLLGSVPTIIFLLLVFGMYTVLVHKPLVRVLADRHTKTEGAVEKARADIAAAEARTADYEQRIREARVAIFKAQEARRQQAMQTRAGVVAGARTRANEQIEAARRAIAQEKQSAQANLEADASSLAAEIVRTVLQPAAAQTRVGGGR
jgi:F-type H+-transporting ATPase subunit b